MTFHLMSGFRHMERHGLFTALSIAGLVIGLTSAALIFLWAHTELGYDKHYVDKERIFLVLSRDQFINGEMDVLERTPGLLSAHLLSTVPEVERTCRTGYGERLLFSSGKNSAYGYGHPADSTFFTVFKHSFVEGDPLHPLRDNSSIAISQALATKLFKGKALDQIVTIDDSLVLKVSSVFADYPEHSTMQNEFIMPIKYHLDKEGEDMDFPAVHTYVKLSAADQKQIVDDKIRDIIKERSQTVKTELFLFAMNDWWLHWDDVARGQGSSRARYVMIFTISGVLILVMACINFINLATARAAARAKEIGVRKMSGATRPVLIRQFLLESTTIAVVACVISVGLLWLLLPLFNFITESHVTFNLLDPATLSSIVLVTLLTGLLAGAYPAFLLSSLKPASVLKGAMSTAVAGGPLLRKTLVVFQFALSVTMIFSSIIVYEQVSFMHKIDLGFDRQNVLTLSPDPGFPVEAFKNEVQKLDGVLLVGEAAAHPMEINGIGTVEWKLNGHQEMANFNWNTIDRNYLTALGFEFVRGRNFSESITDTASYIITEEGAAMLGFEDPIGQTVNFDGDRKIIGVVKDFHNADIHEAAAPVLFQLGTGDQFGRYRTLFIRYHPRSQQKVIADIEAMTKKLFPNRPFEYQFMDKMFEDQFWTDRLVGKVALSFTVISVLISCIGLFGLTLYSTQRRTREIGVRRVLGASVPDITVMLCSDFARPILTSLLLALPFGYYLMTLFLAGYIFRTSIDAIPVMATIAVVTTLATLTVIFQSRHAALRNPADVLKTE